MSNARIYTNGSPGPLIPAFSVYISMLSYTCLV